MAVKKPHHPRKKAMKSIRIRARESSIQKLMKLAKQGSKAEKQRRQRKAEALYAFNHYRPQKQRKMKF